MTVIVLLALGLALCRTVRGRQMLRKLEAKLHAKKQGIAEGAHDFARDAHKAEVRRGAEGSGPAQFRSGPAAWLAKTWQFELPDVDLPSIEATLRIKFPELPWPELPELRLHELKLEGLSWFDFQAKHPHLEWPAECNLAFMVNILRVSLPNLVWPTLPNLKLKKWDWPDWELPPVHLSVLLATLRERFPSLSWPELPNKTLLDLRLPRLTFAEYELHYPNLAPWPDVPDLGFLLKLLRVAFPDLAWPDLPISGPDFKLPDLSLPDWSLPEFEHPDWDLMTSSFDSLAVKLRILISMIQVLSQLSVVYSIPFPDLYSNLLRWVGLLELNFVDMLPLGCVLSLSFHTTLMMRTLLLPALSVIALLLQCAKAPTKILEISRSLLFLVLFLIYPGTSAAIFATFQCEELSDGTRWLRADLSIDCDSTVHVGFSIYAALMILVYPIGTPALYYVLLRRSRAALNQLQAQPS